MAEGNDQTTTTTAVAAATAAAATSTTATAPKSKTKTNWQEVQDTVSRLASHTGVLAVSIFNAEGDIVTQQMTPAGEALQSSKMKKKEKMSSHNQNKQSSSSDDDDTEINNNHNNNNVLGNPKLLTKMMKNANLYVQSLSGHTTMNTTADDNTINADDEENSSANNSNSKSNSTTVEDISFVRIRTQYDEILIAPKLGYTLVVLQDPSVSSL